MTNPFHAGKRAVQGQVGTTVTSIAPLRLAMQEAFGNVHGPQKDLGTTF
jgi:hypothetical protein